MPSVPQGELALQNSWVVSGVFERISLQRGLGWQRLTDDQTLAHRYAWCAKLATLDPAFAGTNDWHLLQEWFARTSLPAGSATAPGTAKAGWFT